VATKHVPQTQVPEEEHLGDTLQHVQEIIVAHWQKLVIGVLVVAAVVVGIGMAVGAQGKKEQEAQALWLRAQQNLLAGQNASALELASTVRDRFAGTESARRSLILIADAQANLGQTGEAMATYERAMNEIDDPILATSARRGLAVTRENAGLFAEAAPLYEELAQSAQPPGGRVYDLRAAARSHHLAGDDAKAVTLLQTLVDRYAHQTDNRMITDQVHLARVAIAEWGGSQ
jgi:predicted negative regulator of RcsB-dependent stress response